MKKLIVTCGAILLSGFVIFVSCKKEHLIKNDLETSSNEPIKGKNNLREGDNSIDVNSDEVRSVTELPSIQAALINNQIDGFDSGTKIGIDNSNWYAYELTKNVSADEKKTLTYITDVNQRIVIPVLVKTTLANGQITGMSGTGLLSNDRLGEVRLNTSTGTLDRPTCPDATNNFSDCFMCAWNELNSDFLGVATCAVNGAICVLVCAGACAVFGNSAYVTLDDNGRHLVTENDVEAFVNLSIQHGVFKMARKEKNTFILN